MRGASGNFFDRLLSRIKKRKKLKRIKKQEIIIEKEVKRKKVAEKKKKEIEINNYFINQKQVKKYGNDKIVIVPKKGTIKKGKKKKTTLPTNNNVCKPKVSIDYNKEKNTTKSIETKKENKIIKKSTTPLKETNKVIKAPSKTDTKDNIMKTKNTTHETKAEPNTINCTNFEFLYVEIIKEIDKKIVKHKEILESLKFKFDELNNELKHAKTKKRVEEIEKQLLEIKRQIDLILEEYNDIKDGELLKLKIDGLEKKFKQFEEINPNVDVKELLSPCYVKMDYYNELSNQRINCISSIDNIDNRKNIIESKELLLSNEKKQLSDLNQINKRLSYQIEKNQNLLKEFDELINNINPKQIIEVQSKFLNTLMNRMKGMFGTFLSVPLLKSKNLPLFMVGLYGFNSSIRSMRAVTNKNTNIKYIPSNDYTNKLLDYKNQFSFVEYMVNDSIRELKFLREEFVLNFGNYLDYNTFTSHLTAIDEMENKLILQSKKIQKLKQKYTTTIDKHSKKLEIIKKM